MKRIKTDTLCLLIWWVFLAVDMCFFTSISVRMPEEGRPWWRILPGGGIVWWCHHDKTIDQR